MEISYRKRRAGNYTVLLDGEPVAVVFQVGNEWVGQRLDRDGIPVLDSNTPTQLTRKEAAGMIIWDLSRR